MELDNPMDFQTEHAASWAFARDLQNLMKKHGVSSIRHEDRTYNYGFSGSHDIVIEFDNYKVPDLRFSSFDDTEDLPVDEITNEVSNVETSMKPQYFDDIDKFIKEEL